MKFFSPDFVLYFLKSTFQPLMEYCCEVYGHGSVNVDLFMENKNLILVWISVSKHYRHLQDIYQKWVCEAVSPALVDLPEPRSSLWISMLSLLCNHHFGKQSTELAELSHFPLSYAWCTKYVSCCFASNCESLSVNATTYKFNSKTFETLSYFDFTIVLCL